MPNTGSMTATTVPRALGTIMKRPIAWVSRLRVDPTIRVIRDPIIKATVIAVAPAGQPSSLLRLHLRPT